MKTAKILLLSDEIYPPYYQSWQPSTFQGIDLIISLGDLPPSYLSFIATVFQGNVLYVHGNHDETYVEHPPLGCIDIDGRIYTWKGIRFLGLGGSIRYNSGPFQYTQKEMQKRLARLWYSLWKAKGIDVLVAHSPARHFHDGPDRPHQGFETFIQILEKYKPAYFFHGHVHLNYGQYPRQDYYKETMVVNGFNHFILEIPLPADHA